MKGLYKEVWTLREQSGFGWDDAESLVTAPDNVWECWCEKHGAKQIMWKTTSFPFYDTLNQICAKTMAKGRSVSNPMMAKKDGALQSRKRARSASRSSDNGDDDGDEGSDSTSQDEKDRERKRKKSRSPGLQSKELNKQDLVSLVSEEDEKEEVSKKGKEKRRGDKREGKEKEKEVRRKNNGRDDNIASAKSSPSPKKPKHDSRSSSPSGKPVRK
jgi:hypothetical protein